MYNFRGKCISLLAVVKQPKEFMEAIVNINAATEEENGMTLEKWSIV